MNELLAQVDPRWGWLLAGALLAAAELVVPGVFLIWLALAAMVTGLIALTFAPPLAVDFAIFAVAAIASIYGGSFLYRRAAQDAPDPFLNKRAQRIVGKRVTICEPISEGYGRATDGDSFWTARGPDMPAGAVATVVAMDENMLVVEPA
ncbi:NfeD family protein [Sphingomonadaceae bacterium G21617-S1]|jgi:membrane protein implicated in regulation of membrane protease activity|uniref:NfeD family protein n=1 Tax=Rhizorhabdus sp. TaxID=1968843 RepID=UPI0019B8FA4C|nr:NfeD family protein [Rhizorhabdus sp.]MBD3759918.1 NfeD family protein [Rhizorhabdus sp.]MCZ4344048.1 NfeD family protein [Sphingomonadaceae bacterium G21617-S1]